MNDHWYALFTSQTDTHAYLLALSLPPSPERDAVLAEYVDSVRASLTSTAAHFEQHEIPPYVSKVLALLAPRGQGDA